MPELQSLLAELISGDDQRAEAAALALAHFGEAAISVLIPLLTSDLPEVRWWGVRALAELPASASISFQGASQDVSLPRLLAGMLQDADEEVRCCALLAITHHPDREAIPDLVRLLISPSPLTCRLAVDALAAIGSPAVPALLQALEGDNQALRLQVVRILAKIGDPQAAPALFAVLAENNPTPKPDGSQIPTQPDDPAIAAWTEHWAEEGLQKMGMGMILFKP